MYSIGQAVETSHVSWYTEIMSEQTTQQLDGLKPDDAIPEEAVQHEQVTTNPFHQTEENATAKGAIQLHEYDDGVLHVIEGFTDFEEIILYLKKKELLGKGTIIVADYNHTLVPTETDLKNALHGQIGKIPEQTIEALRQALDAGCRIAVATNQPRKGHQVAAMMSRLMSWLGGGYTYFPKGLLELGIPVFGGRFLFFCNKYKKGRHGVEEITSWINSPESEGGAGFDRSEGIIIFMGDRETDMDFFEAVAQELQAQRCLAFKLPSMFPEGKALEKHGPLGKAAFTLLGKVIP
jgi:hypothetical protein